MGAAAYNRGSEMISIQISRDAADARRHEVFGMMDNLNAMSKIPNAPTPFGPLEFVFSHGGCWAMCPVTGFGYWFKTLRAAVRAFNIEVTGHINGKWTAIPRRNAK